MATPEKQRRQEPDLWSPTAGADDEDLSGPPEILTRADDLEPDRPASPTAAAAVAAALVGLGLGFGIGYWLI
jgi:hypothetical protein